MKERVTLAKQISILICLIGCGLVTFGLLSSLQLGPIQSGPSSFEAMEVSYNVSMEDSIHLNPSIITTSMPGASAVEVPGSAAEVLGSAAGELSIPSLNITIINGTEMLPSVVHRLSSSTQDVILGFVVCFLSGIIQSMTVTLTKLLKDEVKHFMILTFYFTWSGLFISVTLMLIFEVNKLTFPTDLLNISYVAGHTFLTGASAVLYFVALNYGSAIVISIAFNVEIPMRLLFQYVLASHLQPVEGSVWDICGAIVVTIGIALPAVTQLVKSRMQAGSDKERTLEMQKTQGNNVKDSGYTERGTLEETEKCIEKTQSKDANENSVPLVYVKGEAPIYR